MSAHQQRAQPASIPQVKDWPQPGQAGFCSQLSDM